MASMNALVADGAWLVYGLAHSLVPVWTVAIASIAASTWTTWLLRRSVRGRDGLWAGAWMTTVATCWAGGALPLALAATVLVTCGPQLVSAFASPSPIGLSAATWWIALVDAAAWGTYGVVLRDGALELYGVVLTTTALVLLLRLRAVAPRLQPRGPVEA